MKPKKTNEYMDFLTQFVAPAINKYGFYYTGMSIDYKSEFKTGILDIAEYFNFDLSDLTQKTTCIIFLHFINDYNKTLEEIEKSGAHKTLPPAFKSLFELGVKGIF